MSNLSESLGNMNSVEEEKDMTDNIYSPFENGKWWEDKMSEDERVLDYRYNKFWKVAVYRGNYSKRTKGQGYAVKVKSKIGDLTELSYLFDDFVNKFERVVDGADIKLVNSLASRAVKLYREKKFDSRLKEEILAKRLNRDSLFM